MNNLDGAEFCSRILSVSRASVLKRAVWNYHEAILVLLDSLVLEVFRETFGAFRQFLNITSQQ
jgi:hypothetical protein